MSKTYDLYGKDERKIDNLKRKIRGYEKMTKDLTKENRRLNNENIIFKKQLKQKEDIINRIEKCIEEKEEYYGDYMGDGKYTMYSMMGAGNNRIPYIQSNLIKQILDNKGE